jgi:hypothetical protein
VLAATIERQPDRWYARPWLTWPHAWQAVSIAVLVAIGTGLAVVWSALPQATLSAAPRAAAGAGGRIGAVIASMTEAATIARVLWQVAVEPVAFFLLILAVLLSLACAALWTALDRLALGGASQR